MNLSTLPRSLPNNSSPWFLFSPLKRVTGAICCRRCSSLYFFLNKIEMVLALYHLVSLWFLRLFIQFVISNSYRSFSILYSRLICSQNLPVFYIFFNLVIMHFRYVHPTVFPALQLHFQTETDVFF